MSRTIVASSAAAAATIAANRIGRREYGRTHGGVRHVRLDGWSPDGLRTKFEAFIGRWGARGTGEMTGRDIWLYVLDRGPAAGRTDEYGEPCRRYSVGMD